MAYCLKFQANLTNYISSVFDIFKLDCFLYRFKNGKELKPSKRYEFSYEDDEAELTILETQVDDQGSYMCKASNKFGTVDTECKLTIQGQLHLSSSPLYYRPFS